MGRNAVRSPIQGHPIYVRVVNSIPAPVTETAPGSEVYTLDSQDITTGAEAAAAATSITVTALTYPVYKDNFIVFVDPDGIEYLAEITADADAGATSLTVKALDHTIPNASVALWPPEILDRTGLTVGNDMSTTDYITFNTGGFQISGPGTKSANWSCPGPYTYKNPGMRTIDTAFKKSDSFWLILEYPGEDGYSKGMTYVWKAICTSAGIDGPADGIIEAERSGNFNGAPFEIMPVAA